MVKLSPKIEIINYFDHLINRVDIDIDQSIEKYKEDQVLGELNCFLVDQRHFRRNNGFELEYFDSNESPEAKKLEPVIEWSKSTKVIDYLNQIRQRTIEELRKAQEDNSEYLKNKSCDLNHIKESKDVEEMKSRLFANKFYFQVLLYKPHENKISSIFNLYTILVDFYLSQSDIKLLECLINCESRKIDEFYFDSSVIFDVKLVSIQSISQHLKRVLTTQQYPSHLISFRKRDLLNIKTIRTIHSLYNLREINLNCSSNYLSKLERLDLEYFWNGYFDQVKIEGLSSLKSLSLSLESLETISFGKSNELSNLSVNVKSEIKNDSLKKLFEMCPNIEELSLTGQFSNINSDSFINLKKLDISGYLLDDFNFDLFKNICNQLEELCIGFKNMNDERITKLLDGLHFPNLVLLEISSSEITRLEKKLFDGFPMLRSLGLWENKQLKTFDKDAFSNLKNLRELKSNFNKKLSDLDPELFSCLANLEELHFNCNNLTRFDLNIMDYIVNIKKISLFHNPIVNEIEIKDYFKESKIEFEF